MPIIVFDLAIIAILLVFLWRGSSRGFVLALCGLLAVIIAFVGASFLATSLSPKVGKALEPKFAAAIEKRLDAEIQKEPAVTDPADPVQTPDDAAAFPLQDVLDALKGMGLYEDLIAGVDKAVQEGMMDVATNAAAAVAAAIAQSVAYAVIFLVAFVAILVAWTLLSHGLDLVTRLPGLHFLNKTGGAILGLAKGVMLLFIVAWLMRFSGILIPEETVAQTHLLKFFLETNPVTLLTGV
ncbi:MAG: CvpA family protein [Pseudoflavonifractor sp.]